MLESLRRLHVVMSTSSHYLLTGSKSFYKARPPREILFDLDESRETHSSLAAQFVLQMNENPDAARKVVVFNSQARRR